MHYHVTLYHATQAIFAPVTRDVIRLLDYFLIIRIIHYSNKQERYVKLVDIEIYRDIAIYLA